MEHCGPLTSEWPVVFPGPENNAPVPQGRGRETHPMIKDYKMDPSGGASTHTLAFPFITAVSQTALVVGSWTPGYRFQVRKVSVYATAVTATITTDVFIGATSVLTGAITPVAATETAGTLSATLSALRGVSTSAITVKYTTNGSGAATNLVVRVQIRPYPMSGESN